MHKTLNICMIVKNEEENLSKTLPNNVAGANNVIVVDTGSTDRTKEIAASCGAKVFDFEWRDDFSAARNFSLEKSTADWILWLDADDYIDIEDFKKIKKLINETDANLIHMPIHECKYGSKESTGFYYRDKLFKHNIGAHFERPINEQLIFPEGTFVKEITINDVNIYHWGKYLHENAMKSKNKERIRLYKAASTDKPLDPAYVYMLACKYEDLGEIDKAINLYNRVIELSKVNKKFIPFKEAAHLHKAWRFFKNKIYDEAIKEANNLLETNKEYIEPYCIIASSYKELKQMDKASEILKVAVNLPKKAHRVISQKNFFWDIMRYSQYAHCLGAMGNYKEAVIYYQKEYEANPNDDTLEIITLLKILINQKSAQEKTA